MLPAVASESGKSEQKQDYVDISFKDINLSDALTLIAQKSGVNILLNPSMDIKISAKLKDVHFEKAFELLAKTNGRDLRKIGNTYVFGTASFLNQNFNVASYKMFRLQFADAARVKNHLVDVFAPLGEKFHASHSRPTNSVTIVGSNEVIESVSKLIRDLDIPVHRIRIEAELIKMIGEAGEDAEEVSLVAYSDGIVETGATLTLNQENVVPFKMGDKQTSIQSGFSLSITPLINDDEMVNMSRIRGEITLLDFSDDLDLVPELKREINTSLYCTLGKSIEIGRFFDNQSNSTFVLRITPTLVKD